MSHKHNFAKIPSVNSLLQSTFGKRLVTAYSREVVTEGIREAISKFKDGQLDGHRQDVEIENAEILINSMRTIFKIYIEICFM